MAAPGRPRSGHAPDADSPMPPVVTAASCIALAERLSSSSMTRPRYIVVTPVRNEKDNLPRTIESFVAQTIRPERWVIVDDGSTDGTSEIVDAAAAEHDWIVAVHRADRGCRKPGTGVIEAFYDGLERLHGVAFDFLVKFDADLAFAPDYFERCFERFAQDERLGIGGGAICRQDASGLVIESQSDPAFHVRGATKIYRRECWEQLGGLIKAPGWDTVDELRANMLGWRSLTFADLKIHQLKDTGSADGNWRNWVKNGAANYNSGYHPVFMAAKCVRRLARRPYLVGGSGLAWGYFKHWIRRAPIPLEPELVRYVREQQMNRLLGRASLWDAPPISSAS